MKTILSLILFFGLTGIYAQETETTNARSPIIICKVKLGETADFENQSVKFVEVLSDSRCPENVTCVWAGEAKILVEIYDGGNLLATKEVTVGTGSEDEKLFSIDNAVVKVYNLAPYPVGNMDIKKEDYVLNLYLTEFAE